MNEDIRLEKEGEALPFSDDKISSAISKILEHPELISMVASAIGEPAASVEKREESAESKEPSVAASGDMLASVMPMLSKLSSATAQSGKRQGRHEVLLCALKPYLSSNRCQAIDYIIKISQMSDILGRLR